jgi:CRISPR/Cas system-associated exonuclease Cas4 (RecB family)
MPAGVIGGGDRWVKSSPLAVPDSVHTSVIRGKVDVLVDCDDGSLGVIDFKTTVPKPDHIATYSRQLHAYAWALEHPASGPAASVSSLGLLCFLPDSYEASGDQAGLFGEVEWIEIPRDDEGFTRFLIEVISVLEEKDPPEPDPSCQWCALRDGLRVAA